MCMYSVYLIIVGLVSVEEVEGSKHVLCAYICGPEAVVMEHCSDEEVAEGRSIFLTNNVRE